MEITSLFKKDENALNTTNKKVVYSWYEERYNSLVVQRSWLLLLLALALIAVMVAMSALTIVATSKTFDPFVIQIEDQTGAAKVVNPVESSLLGGNEALAQYFIKKYITARETYNPVDFDHNLKEVVRLFSTSTVYYGFRNYIKREDVDPTVKYNQNNTTYLISKSFSKLPDDKTGQTYMFRFAIQETAGLQKRYDKVAILNIGYVPMQLTETERDINPVGFQVKGYRVDDDNS